MMKMTKKEMFQTLINLVADADIDAELKETLLKKMNHEIELLEKKNASGSKGLTKTQKENEVIKERLVAFLTEAESPKRVSEIIALDEFPYSSSKISRLLNDMARDEQSPVIRTEVKKVAYFGV